jgi:hypothetical protein
VHDESLEDTVLSNIPRASLPAGGDTGTGDNDDTVLVGDYRARARQLPKFEPIARTAEPSERTPGAGSAATHSFRIAGETVALDKPAYVGRRPSLPRVLSGAAPRLIQVPSARREVSGTHLEIRQTGVNVVVSDLGSANGTVVTIPGRPPQRMRRGESLVVTPGTLVDIGDGNLVEILSVQHT